MIRKMALGFAMFLVICVALYLRFHHAKPPLGMAYAGDRQITLWNTSAQIRAPIGTVDYGEPLQILTRYGQEVEVRSKRGLVGWTSDDDLISPELWQTQKDLDAKTAGATPEARGHTRVIGNLHILPGRETPRVRQLKKDIPVELYTRQPVEVPGSNLPGAQTVNTSAPESDTSNSGSAAPAPGAKPEDTPEPKKEDWWLVRAQLEDKSTTSGWILGRFIDLDVPDPLPNYASSAGMRIVAWFELNPVPDADGQSKAQYLLVGTTGAEGGVCDFTMMRVFTWSKAKSQYETAFIDGNMCGKLPIDIVRTPSAREATMMFTDPGDDSPVTYRMRDTIVRRLKTDDGASGRTAKRRSAQRSTR